MVDTIHGQIQWLKLKMADLEDRSRRNRTFRGIPESVSSLPLMQYIQQVLQELIPQASPSVLSIDRAQRISKPTNVPDTVPRDVLARTHFIQIKKRALQAAKMKHHLRCIHKYISLLGCFASYITYAEETCSLDFHHEAS